MLYLVPSPVGNLEDMTLRALRILRDEADMILAEDTRTSRKLLDHYEIKKPLYAYHAFNEHNAVNGIVQKLQTGAKIALLSDAGTPGISDPGFLLVRACVRANIQVICLPGATALIPALAASGLPTDAFFFEGFLPHKKGRQTRLKFISTFPNTVVLYESPHRLIKVLTELIEHCGPDRMVTVAREISKIHESIMTLPVNELLAHYTARPDQVRGEIVVVVAGADYKNG
jgi:16S rRNA (cytidine1402-2'-O)-methyltransferase